MRVMPPAAMPGALQRAPIAEIARITVVFEIEHARKTRRREPGFRPVAASRLGARQILGAAPNGQAVGARPRPGPALPSRSGTRANGGRYRPVRDRDRSGCPRPSRRRGSGAPPARLPRAAPPHDCVRVHRRPAPPAPTRCRRYSWYPTVQTRSRRFPVPRAGSSEPDHDLVQSAGHPAPRTASDSAPKHRPWVDPAGRHGRRKECD